MTKFLAMVEETDYSGAVVMTLCKLT